MATVYHRDQAGAPTYSFNTGTSNAAHFNALKAILKACLVSGYGSKPAAGWALIAEGANHLVLRSGTLKGYVCLTWLTGTAYITVYLAETYTGVVNDVMTGDGLKTGVAAGGTLPHRLYIGLLAYASDKTSWYLIADAATFMFQGSGYNSAGVAEYSASLSRGAQPLYVGDDSGGNFIAVGGQNTTATNPGSMFSGDGFTSLKDPNTGLLVGAGSLTIAVPSLLAASSATVAAVMQLNEVELSTVIWASGGVVAGRLRGVVQVPWLVNTYPSPAAQSLGFSGPLTLRNINTPISLADGHDYFMGVNEAQSCTRMTTNNPVFW